MSWDCPFPEAANTLGIRRAKVTLRLCVDAQGVAESVAVIRASSAIFAQRALECAARARFEPGRDATLAAARSRIDAITVQFILD
jgi:outer membrane biosynthesis protein TonB